MSTHDSTSSATPPLPDYDAELSRYHQAFGPELRAAMNDLSLARGFEVLDVPCGDGFYTRLLAERVGPHGRVVGADALPAYLCRGYRAARQAEVLEQTEFIRSDAYQLPFADQSFDVVWCAQSFISLEHPVAALREFRRVLKPGGCLAVLESDELHHVMLPWPAEFEIRLLAAMLESCRARYGRSDETSVSRKMRSWLQSAELQGIERASYTADRQQPLDGATRRFLEVYAAELAESVRDHLNQHDQQLLARLTDPASPDGLLHRGDFEMTCLFTVWRSTRA